MEVKILKPLLPSKADPENLRPVFVGIKAWLTDVPADLSAFDKVEVHYVKNDTVPMKGVKKAPHGRTVFWKPPTRKGGGNTFTVAEPCFAVEDEHCVPQCVARSQVKCIGSSCNVVTCPLRRCERVLKVNQRGLVVCKSISTTYSADDFAKLSFGPEVMAAMVAAAVEEAAEQEEKRSERAAAKEAKAAKKAMAA